MSSASLNKMTVPIGGTGDQNSQGLLMPKLKYRFRVSFQNIGPASGATPVTELTKQVVSFTRPNLTFEEITLPIYNSTLKLAGRHAWTDCTCIVRDDAGGNVTKLVGQQIQKQMDFLEMSSAAAGIDYKFTTVVQVLDGGNGNYAPTVLEQWELYGCYIKSANYGDLNYGTNEAATIEFAIAYDNANQVAGPDAAGVGIGFDVGRTVGDVVTGAGL